MSAARQQEFVERMGGEVVRLASQKFLQHCAEAGVEATDEMVDLFKVGAAVGFSSAFQVFDDWGLINHAAVVAASGGAS